MTCQFCTGEPSCPAQHRSGVRCTRPDGHPGDHVACGTTMHEIARWG